MIRKLFFVGCLIFICSISLAQEYDSIRSQYVREFPDRFNLKLLGTDRLLILNLRGTETGNKVINYAPNDRGYIGLGAYIFDVGIELAVKVPEALQRSSTRYGETDFIDFQGNVYGRKWCFDGTFQKYQGFYISNAGNVFPDFSSDQNFPQRADLEVMNIIINGIHIFNHQKFSFRSGFNQADRQIKSAGSPLLIFATAIFGINADSLLIPAHFAANYGEAGDFIEGDFYTFSVLPGYAYNFVYKNLFLNLNATGGAGIQWQSFNTEEREQKRLALEPKLNFRAAIGFDNDRFFAGGSFLMQKTRMSIEGMRINNTAGNYKFFIGYRFKEFGLFKKFSIRDVKIF